MRDFSADLHTLIAPFTIYLVNNEKAPATLEAQVETRKVSVASSNTTAPTPTTHAAATAPLTSSLRLDVVARKLDLRASKRASIVTRDIRRGLLIDTEIVTNLIRDRV